MNWVWIVLAVASFVGAQVFLLGRLQRLDRLLEQEREKKSALGDEDCCRYPDGDVIE